MLSDNTSFDRQLIFSIVHYVCMSLTVFVHVYGCTLKFAVHHLHFYDCSCSYFLHIYILMSSLLLAMYSDCYVCIRTDPNRC